jgi:TRAP-type C4-dicarboxylate transport system permease small subunit
VTVSTVQKPAARRVGALGRLCRLAGQAEELLCYALLAALVVTTSLQVFTRYVINAPFTWTEELARMLFIWIVFVGAAVIVKQSSHISIDFVTRLLPPGPRRVALIISHALSVAILLTLGAKAVQLLRITGHSASPALEIPWVCVYAAFPLGMFLMAARYTGALIRLVRGADGPTVPGQAGPPAAGPQGGR